MFDHVEIDRTAGVARVPRVHEEQQLDLADAGVVPGFGSVGFGRRRACGDPKYLVRFEGWYQSPDLPIHAPSAAEGHLPGRTFRMTEMAADTLARELYQETEFIQQVAWLLEDRSQVVFYGPPGTGKTFVAERFAAWFAGSEDRVETIQFHPSYAYEDFVEGIRPKLDGDTLLYRLEPGLLRRFAATAASDTGRRYVLVIDEINRANLSRVFGELLYLLEYRNRTLTLPYSGETFGLPANLFVIGTMNTADRSIALVDFALRRRFHFVEFSATPGVLRRWLNEKAPGMQHLADMLDWVNSEIGDPNFAVGFSYFMRPVLDDGVARQVWNASILPALREYYFDDLERARRFAFDSVLQRSTGTGPDDGDELRDEELTTDTFGEP